MKSIVFSLLLACLTFSLFAQDPLSEDAFVPSAPEAAALAKYVDVPVNMYTGTPNVNVPIHSAVSRDVSLPISISYHAGGNRVTEEASWVGLGWSLNAGGMITREIKDKDDFGFKDNVFCMNSTQNYEDIIGILPKGMEGQNSWFYFGEDNSNAIAGCGDGGETLFGCDYIANDGQTYNLSQICDLYNKDVEPDLFTYNFNGYSGKFIYSYNDGDPKYLSLESQAINIERIPNTLNFEITTPDGVVYKFEETQMTYTSGYSFDALDNRQLNGTVCEDEYISSWYLTSIRGPGGGNISLTYNKNIEGIQPMLAYSETATDGIGYCFEAAEDNTFCTPGNRTIMQMTKNIQDVKYDKVTLSEISYAPFGKVEFVSNQQRTDLMGGDRLNEIKIYNGTSHFKSYLFHQSYFESSIAQYDGASNWHNSMLNVSIDGSPLSTRFYTNGSPSTFNLNRLKLDSIQEVGHLGTTLPAHSFEYEDQLLPPKSSMEQDIWGFYNGRNNHCLIPGVKIINSLDEGFNEYIAQDPLSCTAVRTCDPSMIHDLMGSNRESDGFYSNASILKKINYPTGAFTSFNYEENQFKIDDMQTAFEERNAAVTYHRTFNPFFNRTKEFEILTPPTSTEVNVLLQYQIEYDNCFQTCDCIGFSNGTTDALQFFIIEIIDLGTNQVILTERAINNGNGQDMGTYKQYSLFKTYNLDPGSYKMQIRPTDEMPPAPCDNLYDNIISISYNFSWDEFNIQPINVVKNGAGLRIKSIVNNELTKNFIYVD
ncbi:MAG: hypothetical protein AAGK97_02980 [Bacteroidota bacterium]